MHAELADGAVLCVAEVSERVAARSLLPCEAVNTQVGEVRAWGRRGEADGGARERVGVHLQVVDLDLVGGVCVG